MDILLQRVLYLCHKYRISLYAVEKAANLSECSLKRWGKSPPSCDRIMRVAQYFGVSVDFLLGITDNPKSHLNKELVDRAAKEIKERADMWLDQMTESRDNLCLDVDKKLIRYGLKNAAKVDIDTEEIMNDPALPR